MSTFIFDMFRKIKVDNLVINSFKKLSVNPLG